MSTTFSADADFRWATFSSEVYFVLAIFSAEASFKAATFSAGVSFHVATFSERAWFSSAKFEELSQIFFFETKFSGTLEFNYTYFKGYVAFDGRTNNRLFIGENALLDLQNARIDDAMKISFHTVRLEPSWFINTNATGFVFTDCLWRYADGKKRLNVKTELENLKKRGFENSNALLTKACWQLADNHEESKSFAKSSLFRQFANESRRLESPWHPFRKRFWEWQPLSLHWWYYAVSFYGENWRRAFFVLLGILVLFALLYAAPFAKFDYGVSRPEPSQGVLSRFCEDYARIAGNYSGMGLCDGAAHSLSVASFQRPDPKPADFLTRLLVTLETIFAPLQAALLALAIRRKFMR